MNGAPSHTSALDLAARLAWRAAGYVEPNPLVGCVIVQGGRVIGMGHHARYGEAHAEVLALADARRRGHDPAGATVYVTLEPCAHYGKQPPCTQALAAAKVGRVLYARADPNPAARGGAQGLRAAGIACELCGASTLATRLSDPFVTNIQHGRPYVIAKWAQSVDGKIATRAGQSQWISGPRSRRRVHRLRARVDAVMVGIGTVLADDPRLTARDVPLRRVARRVVIDPRLRLPDACRLMDDLPAAPLTVISTEAALTAQPARVEALRARGVQVWVGPGSEAGAAGGPIDLRAVMRRLWVEAKTGSVLVEGGPTLLGGLLAADLIDEAQVYVGPLVLGDEAAPSAVRGGVVDNLAAARRLDLYDLRRSGGDVRLTYRRPPAAP